jgi:hypothetical protein
VGPGKEYSAVPRRSVVNSVVFRTHPEVLELLGTGALLIRPEAVGGPLPLLPATRQDSLAVVGHRLAFVKDREGRLDGQQQARLARPQVLFVSNP